jgi:quinoprotein glucose dehydrogenase
MQNNPPAPAAGPTAHGRAFSGDDRSNRYSPLDQINRDNVKSLQVAWTWRFDNYGTPPRRSTRRRRR